LAGNQEIAEQIAHNLRTSGQMSNYKIGVKYQDGTAWLHGRVASEEQMNTALKVVFRTPGVTRVVNELTVITPETAQVAPDSTQSAGEAPTTNVGQNPLRSGENETANTPKVSFVKQLESLINHSSEQAPAAQPAPVQTVSAEEAQEEAPQRMVSPQRARPMATRPAYVAMQPTRGPVAANGAPLPMYTAPVNGGNVSPTRYDQPCMPNYAWPSYAAYPNYAAVTYPKQYSAAAWPYIGPFYPYPQVPMGWRKVTLEWSNGWWFLDFKDTPSSCWHK
jgi:hypothetical protein